MAPHTSSSLLALLAALPFLCIAQDSPYCSALAEHLRPNATASVDIPALRLDFLGSGGDDFSIVNESDFNWRLSSSIQPVAPALSDTESDRTQTVVWLDTEASNATRLGDRMRMCHNFIPLQVGGNVTWGHDALEKSVGDTGDCRAFVSEACLQRLKAQYTSQAAGERSAADGRCAEGNRTVPWECAESGMVEPLSQPNPAWNSSLAARVPLLTNATTAAIPLNESLVCSGRNFSRSTGTFATQQDYDLATNFPLMDIMTFFGTMPPGRIYSSRMHRVQIACLVPGQVVEGSREKASIESILEKYDSTGANQTAEDWKSGGKSAAVSIFGRGMEMWVLAVWVLVVGLASAV